MQLRITILTVILLGSITCFAQSDSKNAVKEIPLKYITTVSSKTDKYCDRVTSKTRKTVEKLAKWEAKLRKTLVKADPSLDAKLFGPGKTTFSSMLQKVKDGEALQQRYKAQYDEYADQVSVNLKYIELQKDDLDAKYIQPLQKAKTKVANLEKAATQSESAELLIKERKRELLAEASKVLSRSKYLSKINKEAYYYTATLRNYKQLFTDPAKAEKAVVEVLNKIPAFTAFKAKNSALAGLFGNIGQSDLNVQSFAGLQTRAGINILIQTRISQGGPNAAAVISQNLQAAQTQVHELKNKVLKAGGGNSDAELPDFKPNSQKSKIFKQRLEFGTNFQFGKPNRFTKSIADIGVSIGYKLNDKSIVGLGLSYKMGYGTISKIKITHEGIGVRSFIDYKLKKQFFASGGYELNYNSVFTNLRSLENKEAWQSSGLIGISKKIKLKTKFIKGTKFQLLYDLLYKSHTVSTQPWIFRVGYDFK